MRKLKLEIEALKVESFSATPAPVEIGTVRAQQDTNTDTTTNPYNDDPSYEYCANTVGTCVGPTYCCPPTWRQTCPYSCYQTGECGGSCQTWWCNSCASCPGTCEQGASCTDYCNCPP